jgi:hypothetical protein
LTEKKIGANFGGSPLFYYGNICLILYSSVELSEIFALKKLYPWITPEMCPECEGNRLWGHGYVARCFDGFPTVIWLKRYRCPDCGAVHTMRPDTHYRRIQAPRVIVLLCVMVWLVLGRWRKLTLASRWRQKYWYEGFLKQASRNGNIEPDLAVVSFRELIRNNIIPVTHSLKYFEIRSVFSSLHLRFTVTGRRGFP